MNKKTISNYCGLLGVLALISYTAAVIFAPLGYPGYDWMKQAVSDLSAENAPSRDLWNILSVFHGTCTLPCMTVMSIYVQGRLNKTLRVGMYLFTAMSWISGVGYKLFPLSDSGYAGELTDVMHIVVTALVVILSIASLIVIMVGGYRDRRYRYLAIGATAALGLMFLGPVGMAAVPEAYKGIFERFSVFSATGYTAFLGICMFTGFEEAETE